MNFLSYSNEYLKDYLNKKLKYIENIYSEYKDINSERIKRWCCDDKINLIIVNCNNVNNYYKIIELIGKDWMKLFNPIEIINKIIIDLYLKNLDNNLLIELTIFTKIYLFYYYLKSIYSKINLIQINDQRLIIILINNIINYLKDSI